MRMKMVTLERYIPGEQMKNCYFVPAAADTAGDRDAGVIGK